MNRRFFWLPVILLTGASNQYAAIYQYVFTATLREEISLGEGTPTVIEAPLRGLLVLDTTSTRGEAPLGTTPFEQAAAEIHLLIGDKVELAAGGATVSLASRAERGATGTLTTQFDDFVSNEPSLFPARFTVSNPAAPSGASRFALRSLSLHLDGPGLDALERNEASTRQLLTGTFFFADEGGANLELDFTVSNLVRRPQSRRYSPEFESLRAYMAEQIAWNELDDIALQYNFLIDFPEIDDGDPGGGGGGDDGGLDPIGVIPEPGALPLLLALVALAAGARHRRR
ncbi:MAG: PEP-CTERM sorting domain-containing protein [Opitutales bacterium]